jgi:hypothetical protein
MSEQPPIYGAVQAAQNQQMQQPEQPSPVNPMNDLEARVEAMVAAQVAAVEAKYADKIATMQAQIDAAQNQQPMHLVPEHAGGPGLVLAKVWGQWHQELAKEGKLTPDILRAVGIAEDVIPKVLTGLIAVA